MRRDTEDFLIGLIATGVASFCSTIVAGYIITQRIHTEAVQHGYASYCPDTGAWHWNGECGTD